MGLVKYCGSKSPKERKEPGKAVVRWSVTGA